MIHKLYNVIEGRRENPVEGSYTNMLLNQGSERIAQKVGEEAVELVIAASSQSKERVIEESADLIYHLFVLWVQQGITIAEVESELEKRHTPRGG